MAADTTDTGTTTGAKDDDAGRDGGAADNNRDAGRDGGATDDLSDGAKKAIDAARKAERAAARRAAEAEAKVKEYADRDKTEAEKAAEKSQTAAREAEQAKHEALRLRVALDKKLPAELIDRLQGSTREELETDAETLLKLVKAPAPSFDGGARDTVPSGDMDSLIRRHAGYGT